MATCDLPDYEPHEGANSVPSVSMCVYQGLWPINIISATRTRADAEAK